MTSEDAAQLGSQIRRGRSLAEAAPMIADPDELRYWRTRRDRWRDETAEILARMVDGPAVRAFERAASPRPVDGGWVEEIPSEVEALHGALAVLVEIREPGP